MRGDADRLLHGVADCGPGSLHDDGHGHGHVRP
jgi:hypothetical protein